MAGRLEGKVCIITGASSGMGAETARVFADEGARVVIAARSAEKGERVVEEIAEKGYEAWFVKTDTTELGDLDNLVDFTVRKFGRIDVLISNAGANNFFNLHEMDVRKDFDYTFDLIARANWYLAKLVLPIMMKQGKGDILFTLSTTAINGVADASAYAGSKAAVRSLSKAICQGYSKYGIRCNTIMPGLIVTDAIGGPDGLAVRAQVPNIPMGRAGDVHEIAMAYVFLASDECRFMNACDLIIDGGCTVGNMAPLLEEN